MADCVRADELLLTGINLTADGPGILGADGLHRITVREAHQHRC